MLNLKVIGAGAAGNKAAITLIGKGFDKKNVTLINSTSKDIPEEYRPKLKLINKKPIEASDEELKENSRSHSAKLRIVERV